MSGGEQFGFNDYEPAPMAAEDEKEEAARAARKRAPREVVTVRFSPESIPLIKETAEHMGLPDKSALIRNATAAYVKEHHPVHGTRARRARRQP